MKYKKPDKTIEHTPEFDKLIEVFLENVKIDVGYVVNICEKYKKIQLRRARLEAKKALLDTSG